MKDVHDLGLIIDSRVPIVVLESHDEQRATEMLIRVAMSRRLPLYGWSVTEGLKRLGMAGDIRITGEPESPAEMLVKIKENPDPALYVLLDFHPFLKDPVTVRHLKDIGLSYARAHHTLVLLSHSVPVPPELSRLTAYFNLSLPTDEQIMSIIKDEARRFSGQKPDLKVRTDNATLQALVRNLRGMTFADTRRLVRGAIRDDGAITTEDLPELNRAKFELLDMQGVLSFEYDTEQFSEVGGLSNLKQWLTERREAFCQSASEAAPDTTAALEPPKGILLLGIQGGGKSLAAKAVAGMWHLPLLRLDFGALYNKYIGETERNLREALSMADMMAPCVLWMDEIEKGMATQGNDEGTSRRVLGTVLTWMAERPAPVFLVATSNDISGLPPELVRKGRLDEIFFVDLPDTEARREIFAIHLRKRVLEPESFDLNALAEVADGFSGAEIEQAVVAALYTAAAQRETVTTEHVVTELGKTSPLSVVMAEKIAALRQWADGRTVSAN